MQLSNGSSSPYYAHPSKFTIGQPSFKSPNPSFLHPVANAQIDNASATHATTNNTKFVQNSFVSVTAIVSIIIKKEF